MGLLVLLRRWWPVVLGLILIAVGGVLLSQPVSFGWFAYAPMSGSLFAPAPFDGPRPGGIVLLVLGLALAAGGMGFRLGRRSTHPDASAESGRQR